MSQDGPLDRLRENATGIASTVVTGIWLGALLTGQGWWLGALIIGYVVVVPIVAILFGDEEDREEWWDDPSVDESETATEPTEERNRDALGTLRNRYARGDLTDEQFERKLEKLLETETLEAVEDRRLEREREREPR